MESVFAVESGRAVQAVWESSVYVQFQFFLLVCILQKEKRMFTNHFAFTLQHNHISYHL